MAWAMIGTLICNVKMTASVDRKLCFPGLGVTMIAELRQSLRQSVELDLREKMF